MSSKILSQVERLIEWRIESLGFKSVADQTVNFEEHGFEVIEDYIVDSLKRGKVSPGQLPDDVPIAALNAFRKRSNASKRKLVEKVIQRLSQGTPKAEPRAAPEPPSQTAPGAAPENRSKTAKNKPAGSDALSELARQTALELEQVAGEVYVTLRCFEQLIGKRPEHLRRTLEARGFPVTNIDLPNAMGSTRQTPAIPLDYIFAVVGLADIHGMDLSERHRLFRIQRDLPTWMRKFEAAKSSRTPPAPPGISNEKLFEKLSSYTAQVVVNMDTLTHRFVDTFTKLTERLEQKLDRVPTLEAIQEMFRRTQREHVQGGSQEADPRPVHRHPNNVPTCTVTVDGHQKLHENTPSVFVYKVTKKINYNLGLFGPTAITDRMVIEAAEQLGIFEREPWGHNAFGKGRRHKVEGELVSWQFDLDSVEKLYQHFKNEIVAVNSRVG